MRTPAIEITVGQTSSYKKALEAKLRELLGASCEREEISIQYLADPLDQIRSSVDREMTLRRLDHQAHLIREVETALTKMDEGFYGLCEECEERISQKRLNAIPWARLCIACQGRCEAAARTEHPTLSDAA
jgi:RNA polymerase-binding protein DksA